MKKILFLLFVISICIQTSAQIEMFEQNIKSKEIKALPYDSLQNMVTQKYGTDDAFDYTYHHLIGQTLLYCGSPYEIHDYRDFKKGTYYKVVGVVKDERHDRFTKGMILEDTQTGEQKNSDEISYRDNNFKWVVVGHYEKMKSLYVDKEFIYVGTSSVFIPTGNKEDSFVNLETDTITKGIPENSVWTCVGVQVKPRTEHGLLSIDARSPIVLIFDNPKYGKHYCYLEGEKGKPYDSLSKDEKPLLCGRFQLKSDYEKLQAAKAKHKAELAKKYGASNANLIVQGKIKIGMTKAMCKESWGEPDDINTSIGSWGTHEQWVYGSSYLYFEGNKLTAIQN